MAIRYRMSATVLFRWTGANNERFQGEGVTRDVSVAGLFVFTSTCPPPNTFVQVDVLLGLAVRSARRCLRAEKLKVLRLDEGVTRHDRSGFAVFGEGFSLRTLTKKTATPVGSLINDSEEDSETFE